MKDNLWMLIVAVAERDGVSGISRLSVLWVRRLDERWEIAVNGHDAPVEWEGNGERMGWTVKPYHCAVAFCGWIAGEFSPCDGWIAAGQAANANELAGALRQAGKVSQKEEA